MSKVQKINNLLDLKAEIARVSLRKLEQESYLTDQYRLLKHKVETPVRLFNSISSNVPGVGMMKGLVSGIGKATNSKDSDWLTRGLQVLTPFVLNSTFLRRSGWLKRALVLIASETAVGQVNKTKVSSLLDKVTNFVRPKKRKKNKLDLAHHMPSAEVHDPNFGVPPDSETY